MQIVNLEQNTPEWLEWRKAHRTASDAAAMLDIPGAYRNRQALLKEKLTGESEPVSGYQQKMFDEGHTAENRARLIIEAELGKTFAPAVGILEGTNIAASFDGITPDGKTIWEHKHMTGSKAAIKRYELTKKNDLDDKDMAQVQQQLLVSGADVCIFTVSDGTSEVMSSIAIGRVDAWIDRIKEGWAKFDEDLAAMAIVETDDADWLAAAADLQTTRAQIKELQAQEQAQVARIQEMAEGMSATTVIGGGITCQRVERKGSVDYAAIPQLQNIDLNAYRKPSTTYWKVNVGTTA